MQVQMPIVSLNGVNSTDGKNPSSEVKQSDGFGHLLSVLTQSTDSPETKMVVTDHSIPLSQHELLEAVQFLQASDLSEIESGTVLLEQLLSEGNEELSKLILEHLQLSEEDLRSAIMSFLQGVNVENSGEGTKITEEKLTRLIEELPTIDLSEALMLLVQIFPSFSTNQMEIPTDEKGVKLAKTFKLLELLLQYEKPNLDNRQIKNLLQKTSDKLEGHLSGNLSNSKMEILDKVFNPLIKEVNQQARTRGQTIHEWTKVQAEESLPSKDVLLNNLNNRIAGSQVHSLSLPTNQNQLVLLQEHTGQLVTKDQLIKQFESILAKSHFVTQGGNQKLFIKLYPEHLGALRIELTQRNSMLTAKIIASTAGAKELLESQVHGLRQAFHSQNLQVEKIEIVEQFQQPNLLDRDRQQEQKQQQREQKDQEKHRGNASFEEVLLNVEA